MIFKGKKGSLGGGLLIFLVLYSILSYPVIYAFNQDSNFDSVGEAGVNFDGITSDNTTIDGSGNIEYKTSASWFDGFKVSIFGLPDWVNGLYLTLIGFLYGLAIYLLIRGN